MQTTAKLHKKRKDTLVIDGIIRFQLLEPGYASIHVTAPDASEILLERTGFPLERPQSDGAWEQSPSLDVQPPYDIE